MDWKGAEPKLLTPRLLLRPLRLTDASDLLKIDSDPEVTYFRGLTPLSVEASRSQLEKHLRTRWNKSRAWMFWCIRVQGSDEFVGVAMLRQLNKDWREFEVGYSLARSQWGQGYATEAVRAALRFAFRTLRAHRIVANTYPENAASCRLLEKLGFRLEAEQKQSYWEHGAWQDNRQYALLEDEFRE